MRLLLKILTVFCSLTGTGLLWMGQVGPEDAASNFAKWAKFWGVGVPSWLQNPSVDFWVTVVGGGFLVVGVAGLLLWLRRSGRAPANTGRLTDHNKQATLAEDAEDITRRINLLGATYNLMMPDAGEGYRRHNDMANRHYMRAYGEEIATDAQRVLQTAKARGLLASQDQSYLNHTVVARQGVEEIGRAMLRIVVAMTESAALAPADVQRPIPAPTARKKDRTPFANVRLLYEASSHRISVLTKENVENLVITPEISGGAQIYNHGPYLMYVVLNGHWQFDVEIASSAALSTKIVEQSDNFLRVRLEKAIMVSTAPTSGVVSFSFYQK